LQGVIYVLIYTIYINYIYTIYIYYIYLQYIYIYIYIYNIYIYIIIYIWANGVHNNLIDDIFFGYLKLPQDEQDEANAPFLSISRQPQNRISHFWLHPHYTYPRCYGFTLTCIILSSLAIHPNPSGTRFESPLQFSCGERLVDPAEYGSQRLGQHLANLKLFPQNVGRGIDLLILLTDKNYIVIRLAKIHEDSRVSGRWMEYDGILVLVTVKPAHTASRCLK
jgi:hypothetical protein